MTTPAQATDQVSAAKIAALLALIEAQAAIREQFTSAAVSAAVAAFEAVTDWWSGKQVSDAIAAALRVVRPNQVQAARLTAAYLARAATMMTGRRVRPAATIDVAKLRRQIPDRVAQDLVAGRVESPYILLGEHDPEHRRVLPAPSIGDPAVMVVPDPGVTAAQRLEGRRGGQAAAEILDPGEPYGRAAEAYRYQVVAKGTPNERARAYALVRIAALAETDVTLAVREQYRKSLAGIPGVTGWRRIVRPDRSETGPCGLCVVAADRVYKIEELKPIHNGCVCEVLPIIGANDPGLVLNDDQLQAIYDAAGGTGGDVIKGGKRHSGALQKIRVALVENGELGPVLVNADQHYRGPKEVAKTIVPDRRTRVQAQLDALDESIGRLFRRRAAGEDVDKPLAWQERRINELRRELASL